MRTYNESAILPKDAKRLKDVFRDYSGKLTKGQKRILDDFGVSYSLNQQNHLCFLYQGRQVLCSGTSGDWRNGRNIATKLVQLIEGKPISR
ncbi:MAG: hypothetical protein AABW79_01495 [Nanoarchaeota archaeon]